MSMSEPVDHFTFSQIWPLSESSANVDRRHLLETYELDKYELDSIVTEIFYFRAEADMRERLSKNLRAKCKNGAKGYNAMCRDAEAFDTGKRPPTWRELIKIFHNIDFGNWTVPSALKARTGDETQEKTVAERRRVRPKGVPGGATRVGLRQAPRR